MATFYVWRSDAPANAAPFDSITDAYRAMTAAMAACHDRRIEWCLVRDPGDDREWDTIACGRHGDLV